MKEKVILIQAREQGRQEGFEEGLKKGRLLGEGSTGETPGSGRTRSRSRERSTDRSSWRNVNPVTTDVGPGQASLEVEAAIRSIAERENERVRLQLKAVERELDMEREKMKDLERENGRLEKMAREEREKRAEREREIEKEREASQAKERENMRNAVKKQAEDKDRLRRAMKRLELEKVRIEQLLIEKMRKADPLPYLPMAPPPRRSSSAYEVPRTSSTESHPQRRSSNDSQALTIHFDMLQLPHGESIVSASEDGSAGKANPSVNSASGSASTTALPPAWFTNPPIDYGNAQSLRRSSSTSSFDFVIEPPVCHFFLP